MKREDLPEASTEQPPWAAQLRPWNPLHDDGQAARLSSYLGELDGGLQPLLRPVQDCAPDEQRIHAQVKSSLLAADFPCVAARSAINRKTYRFGVYERFGSADAALALCHDLYEFGHEMGRDPERFTTFIASFKETLDPGEVRFESLLWQQLQLMHGIDSRYFSWDTSVSKDPANPNFSFSIGGRAYFVVGLHPSASRLARVTTVPCLAFNPHDQFEHLKSSGKYAQLQKAIRQRDVAIQGSVNPVLTEFGQAAESRQYSGRAVPRQWTCPFHHQSAPSA